MTSVAAAAPVKTIKVATQSYVDEKEAVVEQKVIQKVNQKIENVEQNLEQNYVKHTVLGDMGLAEGETVSDKIAGVEGRVTSTEGRIDTAEGGIKALWDEVGTLQGGVGSVDTQIKTVTGELSGLTTENKESLVGAINEVGAAVLTAQGVADAANAAATANAGEITSLKAAQILTESEVAAIKEQQTAQGTEIATIKAQQTTQDETIAGVAEDVNANYLAITELQGQNAELSGKVGTVPADQNLVGMIAGEAAVREQADKDLSGRIDSVSGTLTEGINSVTASVGAVSEDVVKLAGRVTTAEGQLTSLGAAIDKIAGGKIEFKGGDYVNVDNTTGLITLNVDTEITPEAKELATSYAVYNYVNAYAIPKPETGCLEGEKLCVLSIDGAGQMVWVAVQLGKDGKIQ